MNKYVNIKNLFMCTIVFIGVLIFILLNLFHMIKKAAVFILPLNRQIN